MLVCIACPKHTQASDDAYDDDIGVSKPPPTKESIKSFTTQLKDVVMKFSTGAYRHCRPCSSTNDHHQDDRSSTDGSDASSEMSPTDVHLFGLFSPTRYEVLPTIGIGRRNSERGRRSSRYGKTAVFAASTKPTRIRIQQSPDRLPDDPLAENEDTEEWVAQVEPGVTITFVALPDGCNDLKRIRFSREMFSKWQAQQWWAENCDMVHELYSVSRTEAPSDSPSTSSSRHEDGLRNTPEMVSRICSADNSPSRIEDYLVTNAAYHTSRSDGRDRRSSHLTECSSRASMTDHGELFPESGYDGSPSCSSDSTLSARHMQASNASEFDLERPGNLRSSMSINGSDHEDVWVEEEEPGVYVSVRSLPGGVKELKRVRFRSSAIN